MNNLIDTNFVIKIINREAEAINTFEQLKRQRIFISVITIGELSYGANKSNKKDYNMKLFGDFINDHVILNINQDTAVIYGEIKCNLVSKGQNIPENDMWLAASAIASNMKLITFDKHFSYIDDLDALIL